MQSCHPWWRRNAFVRRVRWAGTFACGGRQTMYNALMRRYVTMGRHMSPLKSAPSRGFLDPHLIHGSLDLRD